MTRRPHPWQHKDFTCYVLLTVLMIVIVVAFLMAFYHDYQVYRTLVICVQLGYPHAGYVDGRGYCVSLEDGQSVVVPLERAVIER